jgi:GT2 family glycosyltransferase
VPVYRRHGEPNLESLAASLDDALEDVSGELVVALNGIAAPAAGVPEGAVTVDLGVNRGVSPAWNAAARAASGEILCFANDDVVLGRAAVKTLTRALRERPEAGVVGPVGTRWDLRDPRHLDWVDMSGLPPGAVAACEVVSGFLFACRRETWEAVGGFDERYAPMSWEEVDFCTSVRAKGLRCYAVAGVEHRHEWGVSRKQAPWKRVQWDGRSQSVWLIHRRNRRHFVRKWADVQLGEP